MRTLLQKELAEHGWVLAVMIPVVILGHLFMLMTILLQQTSSPIESVALFAKFLLPILMLILCNRLVVQEYSGKTQLFLESLPISRLTMLATKYAFGFTVVLATVGFCFGLSTILAWRTTTFDARFLGIMVTRLTAYCFVAYSFFFVMGMLGRYRIAIYLALIGLATFISSTTEFDSSVQGPFALVNNQFAYEREIAPVQNIVWCAGLGALFCAAAAALGMVREGSIAGLMAEKMSYREKIFIAGIFLCGLMGAAVFDEKKVPEPYQMTGALTETGDGIKVHVESVGDEEASASLARSAHDDLAKIAGELDLGYRPEMFVTHRSDLDADRYETADLAGASGALMRANFSADAFAYESMRPTLIDLYLSEATRYNAIREPRCWVLEGFSEYWPRQNSVAADSSSDAWNADLAVDRRAAYAGAVGMTADDVDHWYSFRERLGQPIIRSAACAGLVLARRQHGDEKLADFLKAILGGDQPRDARADIDHWLRPIDKVWLETMGSDYDEFKTAWADELERLSAQWSDTLAPVPRLSADSNWQAASETSYRLVITPIVETEDSETPDEIEIRYQTLDVFDVWENDQENQLQVEPWKVGQTISLDRLFSRGGRMRWTLAVDSPILQCDVISGWRRQEVGP